MNNENAPIAEPVHATVEDTIYYTSPILPIILHALIPNIWYVFTIQSIPLSNITTYVFNQVSIRF
jgi:hypothetical protein